MRRHPTSTLPATCPLTSRIASLIDAAVEQAMQSPCQLKRGAVIVHPDGYIVSAGYNDQPYPYCCDGSESCKKNCGKTAIHAEQAAILRLRRPDFPLSPGFSMLHVKAKEGKPTASMAPSCLECSKLILFSGISWMHLLHDPQAQLLPGAKVVGSVEGFTSDGRLGKLDVRLFSAPHFHWLTAEYFHRIDLRILDGGMAPKPEPGGAR